MLRWEGYDVIVIGASVAGCICSLHALLLYRICASSNGGSVVGGTCIGIAILAAAALWRKGLPSDWTVKGQRSAGHRCRFSYRMCDC